jgi:signal transduction histidine kinase
MGLAAAATDLAVSAVFVLLWRLDRQPHLLAFGLSFGGLAGSLISSSFGHWIGLSAIAEPFADFFYIGSVALLVGGCLALMQQAFSWRLLLGLGFGFFLIVQGAARLGILGVIYVPPLSGALYGWLALLFFRQPARPSHRLLAVMFAIRAAINLAWPPFHFAHLGGIVENADQVLVVTIALALIVSDLTSARRRAERATAELCGQATALTRLNAQLAEERAQADTANRAKSQFLANVSHELRTPLNAVIGFSDVLANNRIGTAHSESAEYGRLINTAGQHLLGVINDVLDMSRIEAGKVTMTPGPMDLRATVKSALTLAGHQAEARDILFIPEIADDSATMDADEQLIKQVLINLLSNSFKYTEPGGKVCLRARALPGDRTEVTVTDTGIGIPAVELPRIFEPFAIGGSAMTRRRGGIGLGLSITKRLVELHGGTITISSEVGAGTTVTVILPRHQAGAVAAAPAQPVKASAA